MSKKCKVVSTKIWLYFWQIFRPILCFAVLYFRPFVPDQTNMRCSLDEEYRSVDHFLNNSSFFLLTKQPSFCIEWDLRHHHSDNSELGNFSN